MGKVIRAFTGSQEEARMIKQRAAVSSDEIVLKDVPLLANMTFENAYLMYHDENEGDLWGRAYIRFDSGHISSLFAKDGNLPFDVQRINFKDNHRPEVSVDWEFTNEELKNLVDKGLYGFDNDIDPDYPGFKKPKNRIEIPRIFNEVEWTDIPVTCDVTISYDEKKKIPLASIDVKDQYFIRTNSMVTGYENVEKYFQHASYYEEGFTPVHDDNYISMDMTETIAIEDPMVKAPEKEEQKVSHKDIKVEAPVLPTAEEQAEIDTRANLEFERDMRVNNKMDEMQIDGAARLEQDYENSGLPEDRMNVEAGAIDLSGLANKGYIEDAQEAEAMRQKQEAAKRNSQLINEMMNRGEAMQAEAEADTIDHLSDDDVLGADDF